MGKMLEIEATIAAIYRIEYRSTPTDRDQLVPGSIVVSTGYVRVL